MNNWNYKVLQTCVVEIVSVWPACWVCEQVACCDGVRWNWCPIIGESCNDVWNENSLPSRCKENTNPLCNHCCAIFFNIPFTSREHNVHGKAKLAVCQRKWEIRFFKGFGKMKNYKVSDHKKDVFNHIYIYIYKTPLIQIHSNVLNTMYRHTHTHIIENNFLINFYIIPFLRF